MISRKRTVKSVGDSPPKVAKINTDGGLLSGVDTVDDALKKLKAGFPEGFFPDRLPSVMWKHQLYAFTGLGPRTDVDRRITQLLEEGVIRCLKVGVVLQSQKSMAIVFTDDFETFVKNKHPGRLTDKFLDLVKSNPKPVFTEDDLMDSLSEEEIKHLIQLGVLAVDRDVRRWLLSMPGLGNWISSVETGRKTLIRTIRSSRFKEMSVNELEKRKLPSSCKFSFEYLLSDIIGCDQVVRITTPTGFLLRLP